MTFHSPVCRAIACGLFLLAGVALAPHAPAAPVPEVVRLQVDASASGTPLPHFWERSFGSGRAALALRDDYRKDLEDVQRATGIEYVRFHGIFDRDVGVVERDKDGSISYNFSYVDQIYDGLLARGVKPFVELGFMPRPLSSDPSQEHNFWYHPNVMPPKDYAQWDAMIEAFARHLVDRYGIDEVATWYFEVWNEPNLGFWGGDPRQSTYFELYDHTVRALKSVNPRLRVGGPSTAQAAWVPEFLDHVHEAGVPVDFVSSHVYGDDKATNVFHKDIPVSRKDMVCRAVTKVHEEILGSPYPELPLIFSEYNASYANLPNVTDTIFMGPWLANTIRECAGKIEILSYWTFSDVFEEQGIVRTPFYGGFGVIAAYRIHKPAFNAFAMLHRLGNTLLPLDSDSALATRRDDGTLVMALWNYAPPVAHGHTYTPGLPDVPDKHFEISVRNAGARATATIWRLDATHGNAVAEFNRMGRPAYPSREQIDALRKAGRMAPPETRSVRDGRIEVDVPPQGLVVVELQPDSSSP